MDQLLGSIFKTSISQAVSCICHRKVIHNVIYYYEHQQFGELLETVHHDVNRHQHPVVTNP